MRLLTRHWFACAPLLLLAFSAGCDSANDPTPQLFAESPDAAPPANVWPGWRGGQRGGKSNEVGFRTQWNQKEHLRWSLEIPGRGNSSPVIWRDRVFLTTTISDQTGSHLSLVCIDRRRGKQHWIRRVGRPLGKSHHKNGHASSTPVTDGKRVYVSFGSLGLFCFDFQGTQRWQVGLGQLPHQWGTASSPLLVGNLVIQLCDSEQDSSLQAFDQASGELVWRTLRTSQGAWSSPVLLRTPNQSPQIIVNGTGTADGSAGSVIAYSVNDGRELWRVLGTSDIPCPTAIISDRWVVSSSGSNGPVMGIEVTDRPHVRWSFPSGGPYVPTGIIVGKRLYLVSDGGILSCRNIANGKLVWRHRLRDTFSASLVVAQNRIYAVSERGTVYVIATGDKFELLAVNRFQERTTATPALASGEILIRTQGKLHCVSSLGK